jgi:protein-S-isoprenylcysteine O-methyltransferase Ste14
MKLAFVAVRATVFSSGFMLMWALFAGALREYDRGALEGLLPAWSGSLGLPVISIGLTLALWCVVVFVVRGHGTPAPFDAPRKLVAIGPYRYIRNPMYVGGGLALLGFGLLQTSPSIVLFVPVWWLLFHVMVLVYEEPVLRAKFGSDYDDYCRRIPRWIPSLRPPAATSRAWPDG